MFRQTETINFKTFLSEKQPKNTKKSTFLPLYSAFIPLHPTAFIDPFFIAIASGVLLVALIERSLAHSGNIPYAAFLSAFLKIAFPAAGLTALWFLLNNLKFLF